MLIVLSPFQLEVTVVVQARCLQYPSRCRRGGKSIYFPISSLSPLKQERTTLISSDPSWVLFRKKFILKLIIDKGNRIITSNKDQTRFAVGLTTRSGFPEIWSWWMSVQYQTSVPVRIHGQERSPFHPQIIRRRRREPPCPFSSFFYSSSWPSLFSFVFFPVPAPSKTPSTLTDHHHFSFSVFCESESGHWWLKSPCSEWSRTLTVGVSLQ